MSDVIPNIPVAIEDEILLYLSFDSPLGLLAEGGIYAYSALSRTGITRDNNAEAFDAAGYLLPIIVLKARSPLPNTRIFDEAEKITAQTQVMEFWVYQWTGYNIIEQMIKNIHRLMQGHRFYECWPSQWVYTTGYLRDEGALKGASCIRTDYLLRRIRKAV